MYARQKRLSEAPEEQYEQKTFVDRINEIKFIIRKFQKLYDKVPAKDKLFRAKILKQIERSKWTLSKVQIEYQMFKKYKTRTAISKWLTTFVV